MPKDLLVFRRASKQRPSAGKKVRKAFDTVPCKIFIDKLMKYKLDKWTVKQTENWLKCPAQRVSISGTKSS